MATNAGFFRRHLFRVFWLLITSLSEVFTYPGFFLSLSLIFFSEFEICALITGNPPVVSHQHKACAAQGSPDHGSDMYCPENMVLRSLCGSGEDLDCHLGNGDYYTAIQCCDGIYIVLFIRLYFKSNGKKLVYFLLRNICMKRDGYLVDSLSSKFLSP